MSFMNFELLATDGKARRGRLTFPRGVVETPAFMPVGTYGTVKGMLPRDIEDIGAQIILGNTFHLWLRPGTEVIQNARRPARLHAVERADPHRFRRFPGVQPGRDAQDQGGGRELRLAGGRRQGLHGPGRVHGGAACPGLGHRDDLRRMHAVPGRL